MEPHAELVRDIERYVAARGIAESTFGRLTVNDSRLLSRLRNGGSLLVKSEQRIRKYILENPADAQKRTPTEEAQA